MSTNKIIFDLETQKNFSEAGGRSAHSKLRVSVCGAYSTHDNQYHIFEEKDIIKFGEMIQEADQIIGYNIRAFDVRVLRPYFNFNPEEIPMLDIMEEVEKILGHRIRLEAIATATLGSGKTGSGLDAIRLWREGKMDELKKYCLNDVRITKEIYDYAAAHQKLLFQDFFEVKEFSINFAEAKPRENVLKQTSLF